MTKTQKPSPEPALKALFLRPRGRPNPGQAGKSRKIPGGKIQVDTNGFILFRPEKRNENGNMKSESVTENSGKLIDAVYGHIKTNDGTEIAVQINLSESVKAEDFNCHGFTFTDGDFWINNTQIENLLKGDGYTKTATPVIGDVMIQRDNNNEIIHSAIVTDVNLKKGEVRVQEAIGASEFLTADGRLTRINEKNYKLDGSNGNLEFYKRPPNKVIE